eukprot:scaffold497003_cov37-Prasinocladus_malaysianus.AAC.1
MEPPSTHPKLEELARLAGRCDSNSVAAATKLLETLVAQGEAVQLGASDWQRHVIRGLAADDGRLVGAISDHHNHKKDLPWSNYTDDTYTRCAVVVF